MLRLKKPRADDYKWKKQTKDTKSGHKTRSNEEKGRFLPIVQNVLPLSSSALTKRKSDQYSEQKTMRSARPRKSEDMLNEYDNVRTLVSVDGAIIIDWLESCT